MLHRLLTFVLALMCSFQVIAQQPTKPAPREVPGRSIPVPDTVSPQMQAIIGAPLSETWKQDPHTAEEWKALVNKTAQGVLASLPKLRERFGVPVQPAKIAGVNVFIVSPREIQPNNRNRVLLHFHGGYRVLYPGEAGTPEAIAMAGVAGCKVISVDYRMPPDSPFPAALDDAIAVYRELLKTYKPQNIGIFGTSAGGALTITTVLRAKAEHLPMPGAIAPGTPTVDLTGAGDTLQTNAFIDNVLVAPEPFIRATALLYANGRDLHDPFISPIYGDVSGFPPTILTSGTRDMYLSHTVRMHRKLRAAGVEAILQVFEGMSHGQYRADPDAPETKDYLSEVTRFFDLHLGK
jgi:monoterpene epsilon-lactone hydrolase